MKELGHANGKTYVTEVHRANGDNGRLGQLAADLVQRNVDIMRHVDKILNGAKPGDLPVQQPTKFEPALNTKAARMPGLKIPSRSVFAPARDGMTGSGPNPDPM